MPRSKKARQPAKVGIPALTRSSYAQDAALYEALAQEVEFILTDSVTRAGIKIHVVESRVKQFESLRKKLNEQSGAKISDVVDVVGARVVCLFKSDLEKIDDIIKDKFSVLSIDDKIHGSEDTFGYMSVHYVCSMKNEFTGPRYDRIKGLRFEIQGKNPVYACLGSNISLYRL